LPMDKPLTWCSQNSGIMEFAEQQTTS
jgi:hypothetical protein